MILFEYDKTFEGLLTALFEAYSRRTFPDRLIAKGDPLPLFYDELFQVYTATEKADRVWKGLQKRLSESALSQLSTVWLSELNGTDELLFRYMQLAIDTPQRIELNFGNPIVLELSKIWKKVSNERLRMIQFLRFQKTADGIYFAAVEPLYNVLPLILPYLEERFADQHWLVYDIKRQYGYFWNQQQVEEVTFTMDESHLQSGKLSEALMHEQELQFQQLWKTYYKAIAIRERINPRLQRQNMPERLWKYLTEKQP